MSAPRSSGESSTGRALRTYLQAIAAGGGAILVASAIQTIRSPHLFGWVTLAGVATFAGSFRLSFASVSATISIADTFFIASALLFGPGPATISMAAFALVINWRRQKPFRQMVFNTVAPALSLWVGAQIFFLLTRAAPLADAATPVSTMVLPLLVLTIVYFVLNSGLTAVAVGLDTRQPAFDIWQRHFRWVGISYLGAASVSFCLILLIQQASLLAVLVIAPLLAVFHLTLRSSFGRLEDAQRHLTDMDRLYLSTVETLAMAIDAKDDVTHSHVRRVQAYAIGLARALGISDQQTLKAIEAAALLHDTGKLAVPEHILNKPGKLTDAEFEKMKTHVDVGADILSLVQFPFPVVPIVQCHHENWDGSGYPRGVRGADIPIGARILSVVDCFDALTSDRPYRRAMTDEAALDILRERRGRMYDPTVVDTFIKVYRDIPVVVGETSEQREVMQRISQSRQEVETTAPEPVPELSAAAPGTLLAFVRLSRLVSGEATLDDVLALLSTLVSDVMPGVSGAWYLPDPSRDRVVAVHAFGPAAQTLRGATVPVGAGLTGWVAASRQSIVNSDAALDLGQRADSVVPPLRSCMSVPIVNGSSLLAVLSLYADSPDAFVGDQSRVVQMLTPHVADAIRCAKDMPTPAVEPQTLRLVSAR